MLDEKLDQPTPETVQTATLDETQLQEQIATIDKLLKRNANTY